MKNHANRFIMAILFFPFDLVGNKIHNLPYPEFEDS